MPTGSSGSQYNGSNLPPSYVLDGVYLSTDSAAPTNFNYFKSVVKSYNTPFVDFLKEERGDTSVNPHQPTFFGNPSYNHESTTWFTRPNSQLTKTLTSTTSLSFAASSNGYLDTYKLAISPGTWYIEAGEAFSVHTPNKIVIGSAPNSNSTYQVPVVFFDVVGYTGATGVTDNDLFHVRVQTGVTGLDGPLVATGNYVSFDRSNLRFVDTLGVGFTSGNPSASGSSGATFGFLTTLLGAWEVVSNGHSGHGSFTVEVPHMYSKGISGSPVGIPFGFSSSTSLSGATVYTTILRVTNEDGFLFADSGTNVYIGTDGLGPIVVVNDAPGLTVANYTTDQYYSNSVGIHTLGKLTIGSGVVLRDFPTAILAQGTSRIKMDGAILCGNYQGMNIKESAVATISNAIINRNTFGVMASDGGHINFIGSVGGTSAVNILSRNAGSSMVAIDGGSLKVTNTVVRECPAIVAFEAPSLRIDSLVTDVPSRWLGSAGTTGATGLSVVDAGTSGSNFSVFAGNSTVLVKEPSPKSTSVFAQGPSEFRDFRMLGSSVRVETGVTGNFGLSAGAVLAQTTSSRSSVETILVKSTTQKDSAPPIATSPPLEES